MTNLAHITETALLVLAAYLLGCVLGYAIRAVLHAGRGTRRTTQPAVEAPPPELRKPRSSAARLAASVEETVPPPKAAPLAPSPATIRPLQTLPPAAPAAQLQPKPSGKPRSSDSKPATLAQPRGGAPDNLKQIKGIGPKIEASLYAMGIFHIDQIAGWSKANVGWVDAQLSFKGRIRRERWVEQAVELSGANAGAPSRLSNRA